MENPFSPGYFRSDDLRQMGFASVGENVRISKNCAIFGVENISIADEVQIDSFTTIVASDGWLKLGSYIHICTSVLLGCRGGIEMGDFTAVSHGSKLLSASDDFGGDWLLSCSVPPEYLNVDVRPIILKDHAIVSAMALVLPGVTMAEGAVLGGMAFTSRDLVEPWTIYGGVPAKPLKQRTRRALDLGYELLGYAVAAE